MMNQALASMTALAADTTFSATEIMTTSMNSAQGEMMGILAVAVPILAAVATAVVGVKFGLKWLKSIGKAS